jgi:hypothetical protein
MTDTITITGYHRFGYECAHCGRELKHCIATDRGIFGAACLANKLTKPCTYMGRKYRLSTDAVISLAKMARDPARHGVGPRQLTFEAA